MNISASHRQTHRHRHHRYLAMFYRNNQHNHRHMGMINRNYKHNSRLIILTIHNSSHSHSDRLVAVLSFLFIFYFIMYSLLLHSKLSNSSLRHMTRALFTPRWLPRCTMTKSILPAMGMGMHISLPISKGLKRRGILSFVNAVIYYYCHSILKMHTAIWF
jgi:hypothetical protein